jgi:cathepsin B
VSAATAVSVKVDVHPDRLAQIAEINSKQSLWHAAPQNRFAPMAPGASQTLCGVKGDWKADIQDHIERGEAEVFVPKNPAAPIPDSFDSETNWPHCAKIIGDIRDQSNCGCCWAFAGAEAASDRMCIATDAKMMVPLSAEDVCFCSSFDGCDGGQITTPWNYISRKGAVSGGQYQGSGPFGKQCSDFTLPHCHHHGPVRNDPYPSEGSPGCPHEKSPACPTECESGFPGTFASDKYSFDGRFQTASGETAIQQMIMEGGPVETAFTVYSDFENYAGGIYKHTSGSMAGGHAVKFVGWGVDGGVKYWKVANSWNPYWGEQGYFRIVRGTNEGGIEDQVTGAPASAQWSKAG